MKPEIAETKCAYDDPHCPCTDGAACHYEWSDGTPPTPHPKHRYRRPRGECVYCDKYGDDGMMPPHTASNGCESGKHPHCTCDVCY